MATEQLNLSDPDARAALSELAEQKRREREAREAVTRQERESQAAWQAGLGEEFDRAHGASGWPALRQVVNFGQGEGAPAFNRPAVIFFDGAYRAEDGGGRREAEDDPRGPAYAKMRYAQAWLDLNERRIEQEAERLVGQAKVGLATEAMLRKGEEDAERLATMRERRAGLRRELDPHQEARQAAASGTASWEARRVEELEAAVARAGRIRAAVKQRR